MQGEKRFLLMESQIVERLAQLSGMDMPRLSSTLTALELSGVVQRLPGDRFAFREMA